MARLVVTEGPDAGRSFPLSGPEVVVGRGDGCGVQLSDLTVSREHVRLLGEGRGYKLVDLGSRNRTLVNGEPVRTHFLIDGDRVTVGATYFVFVGATPPTPTHNALDVLPSGFETVTAELRGLTEAARGRNRLAGLYAFAEEVSRAERLDQLYPCIARLARMKCEGDRAFLFIREGESDLATAATDGDSEGRVAVSRTVIDKVLQEQKSVLAADTYGDVRFQGQSSIVDNTIRSVMCAPVVSRGRCIGLLYVDIRREGQSFANDDLHFITALAQQAGIAIDNLSLRDSLIQQNQDLRSQVAERYNLIGESPVMGAVFTFIGKVARTDSTVMLNGESGTGKELVARAIHHASKRGNGPFVAVNCAALTETLLESELFGHEKGAFTGATSQKRGRFEMASGGTLFLDEVGELSPACQTKFLRVLEESCFERVGGNRTIQVDVRVIAATNRNLLQMVETNTFRNDLFYRLQVIQIELPPLRTRAGDVGLLVQRFIERYATRMGRRIEAVEPEAIEAMTAHAWPGNVRELKNAIERAIVLGDGPVLRCCDLPPNISGPGALPPAVSGVPRSLREVEADAIVVALRDTGGNKAKAAGILGIDRSTLYKKIKDYEIEV